LRAHDAATRAGPSVRNPTLVRTANVISRSGDVSRKAIHAPHRMPSRRSKRTKQLATPGGTKYVATNCPRATHAARPNQGNGNNPRQNLRRRLGAQSGHNHARCGENAVRPGFGPRTGRTTPSRRLHAHAQSLGPRGNQPRGPYRHSPGRSTGSGRREQGFPRHQFRGSAKPRSLRPRPRQNVISHANQSNSTPMKRKIAAEEHRLSASG
jgi:hypothetical protein